MGHIWTTLALFLIYFNGKALVESATAYHCYSFDTSDDGWLHDSGFYWKWSGSGLPDSSNIPSFLPTSDYMWFQDQDLPPVSGSMKSPDIFTINYGDTVQSNIFRNILQGQENDTDRPVLRFVSGSSVQNVLYCYDYDNWTPISITCTNTASWETKQAQCCVTYPCTGYFRVDGQVLIRDELLAIDDIGINGACDSPVTPTTSPSPTPANWCCSFQSSECGWSPEYLTNGWTWSLTAPDPDIELITSDEYIYIVDTSAALTSPTLTYVPDTATFSIDYYFSTAIFDVYNTLEASFQSSTGLVTSLSGPLADTGNAFVTKSLTGMGLCGGATTCTGTFSLTTTNFPGVQQTAALKDFSVNGAIC